MDRTIKITTLSTVGDDFCPDRIQCPAVLRVDVLPGGKLMQGKKIPADVRAALNMPDDEDAVWYPDELNTQV
jgi:hypothetical protein